MHWGLFADEKSELAYSKGGKRPESQRIETTPCLFWVLLFMMLGKCSYGLVQYLFLIETGSLRNISLNSVTDTVV